MTFRRIWSFIIP